MRSCRNRLTTEKRWQPICVLRPRGLRTSTNMASQFVLRAIVYSNACFICVGFRVPTVCPIPTRAICMRGSDSVSRLYRARGSARGPGKKPRTEGVWPTTMEAISRSVISYNAASAAEHDACNEIAASIVAYVHTLRLRTHAPDEFINLLHQWMENRSVNVALKRTVDGAFTEGTRWPRFSREERARVTEIWEGPSKLCEQMAICSVDAWTACASRPE